MEKTRSLETINLPDGKYYSNWFSYTINIILPEWKDINIKMNHGVRGFCNNIIVEVKEGYVCIE